jgi:hypothetical protein
VAVQDEAMNLTVFWSAMLGTIPSIMAAGVSIYLTLRVNKSLERLKSDLQRDVFKFSKWHEKRVQAVIAIYQAFETYLDFLRKHLYWDWKDQEEQAGPIDQIHDFPRAIQRQIMFLDDELAEKVLQFQSELQAVWNDVLGNKKIASEETRKRLDYEIPAYLPRLRRAINQSMDPHYSPPKDAKKLSMLRFLESGKVPTPEQK